MMADDMNYTSDQTSSEDALADLEAMFAEDDEAAEQAKAAVLTQNLTGFASCFPDWDLHPPVM